MTPRQVVAQARQLIVDSGSSQEFSDQDLLNYLIQAIYRTANRRPDLFAVQDNEVPATPGMVQELPKEGSAIKPAAHRLIDVVGYQPAGTTDFVVVRETEFDNLQSTTTFAPNIPGFQLRSWVRYPKFPRMFLMVPGMSTGDTLHLVYSRIPRTDQIVIDGPDIAEPSAPYHPALVYCVAALSESRASETRTERHADRWKTWFEEELRIDQISRSLTDDEDADVVVTNNVAANASARSRSR